jgi:hypothetical protein
MIVDNSVFDAAKVRLHCRPVNRPPPQIVDTFTKVVKAAALVELA